MGWLHFRDSTSGTSKKNLLFHHTIPMEFHKYHSLAVFQLGHLKNILKIYLHWVLVMACGIFDLPCSMRDFFFFLKVVICGIQFPGQGSNPGLRHQELRVLATGPPCGGGPLWEELVVRQILLYFDAAGKRRVGNVRMEGGRRDHKGPSCFLLHPHLSTPHPLAEKQTFNWCVPKKDSLIHV